MFIGAQEGIFGSYYNHKCQHPHGMYWVAFIIIPELGMYFMRRSDRLSTRVFRISPYHGRCEENKI